MIRDEAEEIQHSKLVITPEMIEAGLAALWPTEVRPYQDEAEVLGRIFRAMVRECPSLSGLCEAIRQDSRAARNKTKPTPKRRR